MKILLSAFAAFTLITAAAHAEGGEGNGNPFPFEVPGVVIATGQMGFGDVASSRNPPAPIQPDLEAASAPPARASANRH
jgi:hypothetical protein